MNDEKFSREQILFLSLVQSLINSTWISLGKLQNPVTKQTSVNLPEAEMSIDLLEMLKAKTRGNLSYEEQNVLEKALADLKMNYLSEKMKSPAPEKKPENSPNN